jgi:hypothetical protein
MKHLSGFHAANTCCVLCLTCAGRGPVDKTDGDPANEQVTVAGAHRFNMPEGSTIRGRG